MASIMRRRPRAESPKSDIVKAVSRAPPSLSRREQPAVGGGGQRYIAVHEPRRTDTICLILRHYWRALRHSKRGRARDERMEFARKR
jgi:hypothetical protein